MRFRYVFLATALLTMWSASPTEAKVVLDDVETDDEWVNHTEPDETIAAAPPDATLPSPVPTPLHLTDDQAALSEVYADTFRILHQDNSCSDFYGGPAVAVEVLNSLSQQLRPERLADKQIGIKMSGNYRTVTNMRSGASFRLFERVVVNGNGPFFRPFPAHGLKPQVIGHFPSHTREARVLMLLHEIAHLVPGENGAWLIPNDGGQPTLSEKNTQKVEDHCLHQLLTLKRQKLSNRKA